VIRNVMNSSVLLGENEVSRPALGQPLTLLRRRIFRAAMPLKF
jgi:hypothetical protein